MSVKRGLETGRAIIGAAIGTIIPPAPPAMETEIYGAQFANLTTGSISVELCESRQGTITGVVEVVSLTPFKSEKKGFGQAVIARVHSEHALVGTATTGSVDVTVLYRYVPGRSRIP